jgi:hypothetical protein
LRSLLSGRELEIARYTDGEFNPIAQVEESISSPINIVCDEISKINHQE